MVPLNKCLIVAFMSLSAAVHVRSEVKSLLLEEVNSSKYERVVIARDMILKGSGLLVLDDKQEIDALCSLFIKNRKSSTHGCGFHLSLYFIKSNCQVEYIPHNVECEAYEKKSEEINSIMLNYLKRMEHSPNSYGVLATTTGGITYDTICKSLSKDGLIVVPYGDSTGRPYHIYILLIKATQLQPSDLSAIKQRYSFIQEIRKEEDIKYVRVSPEDRVLVMGSIRRPEPISKPEFTKDQIRKCCGKEILVSSEAIIEVIINKQGKVIQTKLLKNTGEACFAKCAETNAANMTFSIPRNEQGDPVNVYHMITFKNNT